MPPWVDPNPHTFSVQPTTQALQTKTMWGRHQPLQNVLFLHHSDVTSGFLVHSAAVSFQNRCKGELRKNFLKASPFPLQIICEFRKRQYIFVLPWAEPFFFFIPPDNEPHTLTLLPLARVVKGCCSLSGPFTQNSWEILLTVQLVVVHTCFLCKSTHYRHARGYKWNKLLGSFLLLL